MRKPLSLLYFSVLQACILCVIVARVYAFDDNVVTHIFDKSSPHYDTLGGRVGAFIVKPSVVFVQEYDSNIFAQANNRESDLITRVQPSFVIESDWNLHQIEIGVEGNLTRYHVFESEGYDDYRLSFNGRYDIDYGTYLTLNASSDQIHENRSSLDDPDGDEPVQYRSNTARVGFARELGIVKLYLSASLQDLSYDDSVVGNTIVDNSIRDYTKTTVDARLAYSFSDNLAVFGQVAHNQRQYDVSSASFRDSSGEEYRAGLSVNITGKTQGELYAGYITQDYDANLDSVNAVTYGGSLLWNVSEFTSVTGLVERELIETTLANSSGAVRTTSEISVGHALKDNVLLGANIGLTIDDYEGDAAATASRNSQRFETGVTAEYRLNRNWRADMSYNFTHRDFETAPDYDRHNAMLSLRYAY